MKNHEVAAVNFCNFRTANYTRNSTWFCTICIPFVTFSQKHAWFFYICRSCAFPSPPLYFFLQNVLYLCHLNHIDIISVFDWMTKQNTFCYFLFISLAKEHRWLYTESRERFFQSRQTNTKGGPLWHRLTDNIKTASSGCFSPMKRTKRTHLLSIMP